MLGTSSSPGGAGSAPGAGGAGSAPGAGSAAAVAVPLLRVVRGDPSPEELAALVTVIAAASSGAAPAPRRPRPEWSAPRRAHRRPLTAGPGGWRSSGLPS